MMLVHSLPANGPTIWDPNIEKDFGQWTVIDSKWKDATRFFP
jgi:hypothetical protein